MAAAGIVRADEIQVDGFVLFKFILNEFGQRFEDFLPFVRNFHFSDLFDGVFQVLKHIN